MKLAEFYFRSGEDEQGMEVYNSYLRNIKSTPEIMKLAKEMIVRKRPEDAVRVLKSKADLSENCELHYLLGCAYEDSGKNKLAVREFKRVIELSGKLNNSKQKSTSFNNFYSYRNPWKLKLPPSVLLLTSIRQISWQGLPPPAANLLPWPYELCVASAFDGRGCQSQWQFAI